MNRVATVSLFIKEHLNTGEENRMSEIKFEIKRRIRKHYPKAQKVGRKK